MGRKTVWVALPRAYVAAISGEKCCRPGFEDGGLWKRYPFMRIVSFVFHTLSALALLAAIVAGTLDAIQSVSASSVILTSLGNAWLNLDPESLTLAEIWADNYLSPDIWRPFIAPALAQPACAVFLAVSLIFWMAGYQRPRVAHRLSA